MIDEIIKKKTEFIKRFKVSPTKIHLTSNQIKALDDEFIGMHIVYKKDYLKGTADKIILKVYGLKIVDSETGIHLSA